MNNILTEGKTFSYLLALVNGLVLWQRLATSYVFMLCWCVAWSVNKSCYFYKRWVHVQTNLSHIKWPTPTYVRCIRYRSLSPGHVTTVQHVFGDDVRSYWWFFLSFSVSRQQIIITDRKLQSSILYFLFTWSMNIRCDKLKTILNLLFI